MSNLTVAKLNCFLGKQHVLKDIDITCAKGKVTAIVGPNGAGKTTLLKCIAGVIHYDNGTISNGEINLTHLSNKEKSKIQAYVPQSERPTFVMSVSDYIMLGRKPYISWMPSKHDHAIVNQQMKALAIENLSNASLDEISGGEYQKVSLARALAQQTEMLLLDEPTSALDIKYQIEVMQILQQVARKQQAIVIVVMHDLNLVARFTDQLFLIKDGRIVIGGSTRQILNEKYLLETFEVNSEIISSSHGNVVVPYIT